MTRRVAALAAMAAGALLLTGCAGDDNPLLPTTPTSERPDITLTFTSAPTAKDVPDPDQVTPQAAQKLCDMLRPEVGKWRGEAPGVGKLAFNASVHEWAARSGGLNDLIVKDRGIVDTLTTQHCPDVRQQVLDALRIDDLASGLAGFGR
ncbi:hypothetical protein [Nocardia sp. NPDC052566]|uniref:hypothetical protein n=1 Tax=Nocardia sp. NPDC052566 TaxID=3364330 RepID=UPI0037C9051D